MAGKAIKIVARPAPHMTSIKAWRRMQPTAQSVRPIKADYSPRREPWELGTQKQPRSPARGDRRKLHAPSIILRSSSECRKADRPTRQGFLPWQRKYPEPTSPLCIPRHHRAERFFPARTGSGTRRKQGLPPLASPRRVHPLRLKAPKTVSLLPFPSTKLLR